MAGLKAILKECKMRSNQDTLIRENSESAKTIMKEEINSEEYYNTIRMSQKFESLMK